MRILLLLILSSVLLASVVRFGLRTYQIPVWDEQHYMRMTTEFYRLLKDNPEPSTINEMLSVVPFRQIGYPLLILPFLFTFGLSSSYFWALFTNGLLYVASIFGIYLLSKNYLSGLASLLASFIFAFYGWTLLHLHTAYSETATSAMTIWAIFFLIKSNFFQNRRYAILFGLFLGLGLLVKWITIVYVWGVLLFVFYKIIAGRLVKNKKVLINATVAFAVAVAISFYPYYHNSYWIFEYFWGHRVGGPMWQIVPEQERNPLSLYSLTFYLNSFSQLGIFYFILIIVGFVLALRRKSNLKPILLTVFISYLFSAFALLKAERHIIPIYPYLAILSASVFDYVKNKRFKLFLVVFTIILGATSFLGSVWGKGPMKESLYKIGGIHLTTISRPPYIYKISGEKILEYIVRDSEKSGIENPQVLSLFYFRPLDEPLMVYNLYNQEKPLQINNYLGTIIGNPDKEGSAFIDNVFKNTHYIITKSGRRVDDYFGPQNYKTLKALINLFDNEVDINDYYEQETKIWIYQDSSEVTIYKKKREVSEQELKRLELKFVEILKG